ncbi:hypothetical protein TH66_03605 [Carbonactinospora thermoautotrophica]|uniref:Uncharacterized protein n=1 Tax=Carbonactinospora thermoautotrophica TaxID=1469144 RepID=A0A132N5Q0_9ACTN|nr:nucleotidyltransferase domain-containing protein [Carbonactinospora thermoautotrophica]KWX00691.1 hypothetical protein LI90_1714 [Carbonactinospora thermoautotrophica]KWX05326.1 hypothetical protein TH66_03605 [Carbonactinospora thermoautotrophica]KWX08203.1 hypothetical protein TR74_16015 [Carbonactinospora thermoautotrophica]
MPGPKGAGELVEQVFEHVTGLWWPEADEDKLREMARAWRDFADALEDVAQAGSAAAHRVTGEYEGAAIDAFAAFWRRYSDGDKGALPDMAHACRAMAQACEEYADEVARAKEQVIEQVTILGATILAGLGLAVATAGVSAGASAAATTTLINFCRMVGIGLSRALAQILARTMVGAAFGAVEAVSVDLLVAKPMNAAFGNPVEVSLDGVAKTALAGAAGGGIAGGAAGAAVRTGSQAGAKLASTMDSPIIQALAGGAAGATSEYIATGQVTTTGVLFGAIGGAAGGSTGTKTRHAVAPKIFNTPQKISKQQFEQMSALLRDKAGHLSDDIVVQGSRAGYTALRTSDIDIAIRVDADKFDQLIHERFGTPNPGSAKERTMLHAIETGKIQAGEAGLRALRKELEQIAGMDVDVSIVKSGGPFDNKPRMPIQ